MIFRVGPFAAVVVLCDLLGLTVRAKQRHDYVGRAHRLDRVAAGFCGVEVEEVLFSRCAQSKLAWASRAIIAESRNDFWLFGILDRQAK